MRGQVSILPLIAKLVRKKLYLSFDAFQSACFFAVNANSTLHAGKWNNKNPDNAAVVMQKENGLFKRLRHLVWLCIRRAERLLVLWRWAFAYWLWGIEGVNSILQQYNSAHVADLLVRYGAVVGSGHDLNSPLLIHNATKTYSNLTIGQQCHLGKGVLLNLRDKMVIEDRANILMGVRILTHSDVGRRPLGEREYPARQATVVSRRCAYIGAGTTV